MRGRRRLGGAALAALTVVLAASGSAAREDPLPGWFDLEVPGGELTLRALDVLLDERALTLPVLARALHDRDEYVRLSATFAELRSTSTASAGKITIPAPLDANAWRDILPPVKPPAASDLFTRIATDRYALLTASGLFAASDSVRAWLARERNLLRFVYQQGAPAFAIVARRLEIDDGRIVVPGGRGAEAAWEALAGVPPSRTEAFVRALLTKDEGRLAWYYDTIASLDSAQLAAAWPASVAAAERGRALYPAFRDVDPQWRLLDQPYRRGAIDGWMLLTQTHIADGFVASPLPQATWALLFSEDRINPGQVSRTLQGSPATVSLPWLLRETLSPVVRERRTRYEMFRLAQRVFSTVPAGSLPDAVIALSGMRCCRALVLTLERMQIADPRTWAAAVTAAQFVNEDSDDRRSSLVIFQATIALLERMRNARTLDVGTVERLMRSLSEVTRANPQVGRSIARWIVGTLIPTVPRLTTPDAWTGTTAYESTLLQALAGPAERTTPPVEWEGLRYVSDPVGAEHERLKAMRALLSSPGLDAALAADRPRDLADALTTLVYTTALGDPDGPASLSPEVVSRHQYGLNSTSIIREELPWAPPEERQGQGAWHVQGSLLGLDLALSRLALRRIADQQMPQAPTLTLNDVGTLTRTVVALVPGDLTDADRNEIAASIARGRERVRSARDTSELAALARACGMSDTTRQLLPWIASRQREVVLDLFALRDLFWLGAARLPRETLDRWGVAADGLDGRRVLTMPGPSPWEDYAGRSETGQLTTQVPDLTLRLAEETARLRLPAQLIPALLAFAMEDYWHDVRARFADDWPRLTRHAAAIAPDRIQDYVAALAGAGPLRVR
jgi:hypothetical protein